MLTHLIRIPNSTLEKVSHLRTIENPYLALVECIDLIENFHITERAIPLRYNESDGSVKEWVWGPANRIPQVDTHGFLLHNEAKAYITNSRSSGDVLVSEDFPILHDNVVEYLKSVARRLPILLKGYNREYVLQDGVRIYGGGINNHRTETGTIMRPLRWEMGLEGVLDTSK